jgi:hypothetical protein
VAPSLRGWSRDPRDWIVARRELGEALAGARASR